MPRFSLEVDIIPVFRSGGFRAIAAEAQAAMAQIGQQLRAGQITPGEAGARLGTLRSGLEAQVTAAGIAGPASGGLSGGEVTQARAGLTELFKESGNVRKSLTEANAEFRQLTEAILESGAAAGTSVRLFENQAAARQTGNAQLRGGRGLVDPTRGQQVLENPEDAGRILATIHAEQAALARIELAASAEYIDAIAALTGAYATQRAQVAAILAVDGEYIENRAATVQANRQVTLAIQRARQATDAYAETEAQIAEVQNQGRSAMIRLALAEDSLAESLAERGALEAAMAANVAERHAAGPIGDDETLASAQARRLAAGQTVAADRTELLASNTTLAAEAVRETAANARIMTRQQLTMIANQNGEIGDLAAERVARQELRYSIEREAINQRLVASAQQGVVPTRTQFLAARLRERSTGRPVDPLEQATLGQGFQQRLITTAQFAAAGVGLRLMTQGLSTVIKQAEELQRAFSVIQEQFRSIGQAGAFRGFRQEMLAIARDTGISSTEVAEVGRQMVGVYGEDVPRAMQETRAAITASLVTGLPQKEIVDSLTAASLAYGKSIDDITDKSVGIEQRFGVLARESLQFFGDISDTAATVGLNLDQLGAVAGVLQQKLGISGGQLSEQFGRVLASLGDQGTAVLGLFQQLPQLQGKLPDLEQAIGTGKTGDLLFQIAGAYDQLSSSQQHQLATQIGGARQFRTVNALLTGLNQALKQNNVYIDDSGKAQQRAAAINRTFAQQMARLRETVKQFGDSLFQSGLGEFLTDLASGGRAVADVFGELLRMFSFVNQATGGLAARILIFAAAWRGLALALKLLQFEKVIGFFTAMQAQAATSGVGGLTAAAAAFRAARSGTAVPGVTPGLFGPPAPAGIAEAGAATGAGLIARTSGAGGAFLQSLGINPGMIATIGGVLAYSEYDKVKQASKQQADSLKERIQKAVADGDQKTLDLIQERAKSTNDLWSTIANVVGIKTPDEVAPKAQAQAEQQVANQRRIAQINTLKNRGLIGDTVQRNILRQRGGLLDFISHESGTTEQLIKSLGEGNLEAIEDADKLLQQLVLEHPELQSEIDSAAGRAAEDAKRGLLSPQQASDQALKSVQQVQHDYETGLSGAAVYIEALNTQLQGVNDSIRLGGGEGVVDQQLLDTRNQIQQTRDQLIASTVKAGLETVKGFESFQNIREDQAIANQLSAVNAALAKGGTGGQIYNLIDPETRGSLAEQTLDLLHQQLLRQANQATSLTERQRILNQGIQLTAQQQQDVFDELVRQGVLAPPDFFSETSTPGLDRYLPGGKVTGSAAELRDTTIAQAQAERDKSRTEDAEELARIEQHIAQVNLDAAKAAGLAPDIVRAEAAKNDADRQARDAGRAVDDARRKYARGTAESATADAKAAQEDAAVALDRATGEAAKLDALGQQARADRQMRDAIAKIHDSQLQLLQANSEAAGDMIRSAEIGAQLARDALNRALAEPGTGEEVLNPLRASLVKANDQLSATRVSETKELIDFQLQMHQITVGQAIAQLQALLASPDVQSNQQRVREIQLAIQGLKDQVAGQLQFNIGDLRLPALYEARRIEQQGAARGGYADNRQVSISILVNNQGDLDQAVETFTAAVNAPSRYGTAPRIYPSMN